MTAPIHPRPIMPPFPPYRVVVALAFALVHDGIEHQKAARVAAAFYLTPSGRN